MQDMKTKAITCDAPGCGELIAEGGVVFTSKRHGLQRMVFCHDACAAKAAAGFREESLNEPRPIAESNLLKNHRSETSDRQHYDDSHGLKIGTASSAKSLTLRVTRVRSFSILSRRSTRRPYSEVVPSIDTAPPVHPSDRLWRA